MIVRYRDLFGIRQFADRHGFKVCFTYGSYDLFHDGHIEHFSTCREIVGKNCLLVVGVRNDQTVKMLKGELRPVLPQEIRAISVAGSPMVDFVIKSLENDLGGITALGILQLLRPDYYIVPPGCELYGFRQAFCQNHGIDLVVCNRVPPLGHEDDEPSTTAIIRQLNSFHVPAGESGGDTPHFVNYYKIT